MSSSPLANDDDAFRDLLCLSVRVVGGFVEMVTYLKVVRNFRKTTEIKTKQRSS